MFHYTLSRRGHSHVASNKPNQDAHRVLDLPRGEKLAVVCDGLGSCKYSQEASRFLADFSCEYINDNYPVIGGVAPLSALIVTALSASYKALVEHLQQKCIDIEDAHSTLHIALYDGDRVFYGGAGDGVILGIRDDGSHEVIFHPQDGMEDSATYPFTSPGHHWSVNVSEGPFASVIVGSDGLGDVFHPEFLRPDGVVEYMVNFLAHTGQINPDGRVWDDGLREYLETSTLAGIDGSDEWYTPDDVTCVILVNEEKDPPLVDTQTKEFLEDRLRRFVKGEAYDDSTNPEDVSEEMVGGSPGEKESAPPKPRKMPKPVSKPTREQSAKGVDDTPEDYATDDGSDGTKVADDVSDDGTQDIEASDTDDVSDMEDDEDVIDDEGLESDEGPDDDQECEGDGPDDDDTSKRHRTKANLLSRLFRRNRADPTIDDDESASDDEDYSNGRRVVKDNGSKNSDSKVKRTFGSDNGQRARKKKSCKNEASVAYDGVEPNRPTRSDGHGKKGTASIAKNGESKSPGKGKGSKNSDSKVKRASRSNKKRK